MRTLKHLHLVGGFCLLLLARAATAQPASEPGAVPVDELGLFSRDDLSIEINLGGALLRLVAAATEDEDSDFAKVVAGLRSVTVRIASPKEGRSRELKKGFDRALAWLDGHGWEAVVKVREGDSSNYIYLREVDGKIAGVTVLFSDEESEAGVINIVGTLDPARVGRLLQGLDLPQADEIAAGIKGARKKLPAESPPQDSKPVEQPPQEDR